MIRPRTTTAVVCTLAALLLLTAASPMPRSHTPAEGQSADWKQDAGWQSGKAEWALYDAVRRIYGEDRSYEATIFTNLQHMDPKTTVKTDQPGDDAVHVFKHNVSEVIPTPHYDYRFLTTSFVRRDDLTPFKVVMSSQEDCGATFKRFVIDDGDVSYATDCYFPTTGPTAGTYKAPGNLALQDTLSLTLRSYPFGAAARRRVPVMQLDLVPDQTHTRPTSARPVAATVTLVAEETLSLPYGTLRAWHLVVRAGDTESHYWFSAEPDMRRVMVQYDGPYGVRYQLKELGWWAYWDLNEPAPRRSSP